LPAFHSASGPASSIENAGVFLPASKPKKADFHALFSEHAGFVWRALKRHGVPAQDLEDGCQEVFLVVHRRHCEFAGRSTFRTWLYGIAVRVATSLRRKAHVREQLADDPSELAFEPAQERALEHKQRLSWLDHVLRELDDEKREAFVLYELEGMNVAELAQATDVPQATALSRLHQAREEVLRKRRLAQMVAASQLSSRTHRPEAVHE
jgi:RNA polymerase sigma-70 factor (ECF subfamily)